MTLGGMNALADQIFQAAAGSTARQRHRYQPSYAYITGCGLNSAEDPPSNQLAPDALHEEIANCERLGPYERQLLAAILRAPHSFVVVRGERGSGKSATLRHIMAFYDRNASVNSAVCGGLQPRIVTADLGAWMGDYHSAERSRPGSGLHALYEKMATQIRIAISMSVRRAAHCDKLTASELVVRLIQQAYHWIMQQEDVEHGRKFEWEDLLVLPRLQMASQASIAIQELNRQLTAHSKHEAHSSKQLRFWCAIYDALAIKTAIGGKSALLLVDNIDHLPAEARISLRRELMLLATGVNFKLILPESQATSGIRMKNMQQYSRYEHRAPNPVAILSIRLLDFIAAPTGYQAYQCLSEEWRDKALHRALEIVVRLMRGTVAYRTLGRFAAASAGNSVRQALLAARTLFVCKAYPFESLQFGTSQIAAVIRELRILSCSGTIALLLHEEIVGLVADCSAADFAGVRDSRPEKVAAWSQRLAAAVGNAAYDSLSVLDDGQRQAAEEHWESLDACNIVWESVETAKHLTKSKFDMLRCDMSTFFEEAADSLRMQLQHRLLGGNPNSPFARFANVICRALRDTGIDKRGTAADTDFAPGCDHVRELLLGIRQGRSHAMVSLLLQRRHLHNWFIDHRGKPSPLPLTLLYYLALQPGGAAPLQDILPMLRLELSKTQVLKLVQHLCSMPSRALFLDRKIPHDSYETLHALADEGATVLLTHGGWAYCTSVLDETDYLIPGLLRQGRLTTRREVVSHRLECLVQNLDLLLTMRGSTESANDLWNKVRGGVVADIVVRTTHRFSGLVHGHFAEMRMSGSRPDTDPHSADHHKEMQQTRRVAIEWAKLLNRIESSVAYKEFQLIPEQTLTGSSMMTFARIEGCKRIEPRTGNARLQSAKRLIEDLLQGTELWASGFAHDSYHPRLEAWDPPQREQVEN